MIPAGETAPAESVIRIGIGAPRLDRIGTAGIPGTARIPREDPRDFLLKFSSHRMNVS
jgi:hypothetical protein